jgi:hypothetical protein
MILAMLMAMGAIVLFKHAFFPEKPFEYPKNWEKFQLKVKGDFDALYSFKYKAMGMATRSFNCMDLSFQKILECKIEHETKAQTVKIQAKTWGGYTSEEGADLEEASNSELVYGWWASARQDKLLAKLQETYPNLKFEVKVVNNLEL